MNFNIVSQIEKNCVASPQTAAITYLGSDGTDRLYTRAQFLHEVKRAAAYFSKQNFPQGSVLPIIQDPSLELWVSFYGAMAAGLIPTILSVPNFKTHIPTYNRNINELFKRYAFNFIITSEKTFQRISQGENIFSNGIKWINTEDIQKQPYADDFRIVEAAADDIAFLQHSSGSTGVQKGVALTHKMVLDHVYEYAECIQATEADKIISWLPLYHDMGLIACCLLPMINGIHVLKMSSVDWVKEPLSLFKKIDEYKASLCWLPNFAYQFLAEKVEAQPDASFDLSSMRMWVNCSEPVMDKSHQYFYQKTQKFKVKQESLSACYAMAENVYAVTQVSPGQYPKVLQIDKKSTEKNSKISILKSEFSVMSSGRILKSVKLKIVDDQLQPLPEGFVGQIAINGPSRFSGYYLNENLTAKAIDGDGYFLTGDLGFIHEGEVFVTGRIKDLIIIAGRNFYANDVETIMNEIEHVKKGRVVAFGVTNMQLGTEDMVLMLESEAYEDPKVISKIKLQLKTALMTQMDCKVDHIQICPPNTLIKTSSGKIARLDNKNSYIQQNLHGI